MTDTNQPDEKATGEKVFEYAGKVYVRPCGRGVVLRDHPHGFQLDDVLKDGDYYMVVTVYKETPDAR